ncbi:cytochrome b-c1 complex subunit 7 [Dacryopinax primogenitus]|uniref:Complex III subunit 7 n=1 Tax=Dacryopinax primogenitus (strain DJM 731) TaxID=1858805 RepID=M5FP49_DACPD|nr:cytochrome b-c1 complex subunit 7 [Dacryopinax primogenitus]EJT96813.1 cytochrome b-c1 complex subunit 7 [Dacryopinax primogenitus]
MPLGGPLGISFGKQIIANRTLYRWVKPVAAWYADLCGYRKMGLRYDDLLIEENPTVEKALTRLNAKESYDRVWRHRVAMHQSVLHKDLPKAQWLKPQDDVRYLTPLIEEVEAEARERRELDTLEVTRKK